RDKGQEVLLHAFAEIRAAVPDCHAILVGTGGEYHRQLDIRKELGLDECVHYTLFREDIARLTSSFSVALLAATACDASSTVLKEAMKLGVPVVGTDVGGTSEILAGGKCGIIVNPDDPSALAKAIIETIRPAEAGVVAGRVAAAKERVDSLYTMSAVAKATEGVYRQALEG
ncbi:MAG: glycosyltransferase family 4 protein, partial [Planctomycetes bacterium]|nr:glycosyltransferase family 4 protein [Planctomycetota bacterium]